MKALILIGAMLIAGCSASISSQPSPEPAAPAVPVSISQQTIGIGTDWDKVQVTEFKLSDGTRCVTAGAYKVGAGITCDWTHEQTH